MFFQQTTKNDQTESNFKVYGRIRPFNREQAKISGFKQPFQYDFDRITVNLKNMDHTFVYDKIFSPQTTQEQIFNYVTKNVINNTFQGINSTILCYGQTSSGKTHTIVGDFKSKSLQNQGLLPRILRQILNKRASIIQDHTNSMLDVRIKLSMVQIYNQKIIDLLARQRVHLRLRENKKKGLFIDNVTQKFVISTQQGMDYVISGLQQRTVGRTNDNVNSSRSHMMVILTVTQTDFHKKQARSAKLMLVDLAGSERLSRAGIQGKMVYQTKKINLSLSTLGKVISAITDPLSKHIPYRDSKLTRLLKQSIGGNALTSLIVNLSPSVLNINQTVSSLRFGARAKMVKNRPRVNKQYTVQQLMTMLQKAQQKIRQLVKYIGELQNIIASNIKNDVRLTQRMKTQRPILSLQVLDDIDHEQQDTQSQSSISKLSQSLNNMSQTIGSQGYSMINQLQERLVDFAIQKPRMRKSQSCLNMTIKEYHLDSDDIGNRISSEKIGKFSHSPKNFVFMSTKQEQEKDELQIQAKQKQQNKIVTMFQTVNCEKFSSKYQHKQYELEDIQQTGCLNRRQSQKKQTEQNVYLRLISNLVELRIDPSFIQLDMKQFKQNVNENKTCKMLGQMQDELNSIKELYNRSQQKLAKYKGIIKKQDSYIIQLKQRHKEKKMRLSKDISQLQQHLWEVAG